MRGPSVVLSTFAVVAVALLTGVAAQGCTTTDPKQQAALADFVIATKGDGTAWASGFDPETDDACDTFDSNYIGCVPSEADPTICDVEWLDVSSSGDVAGAIPKSFSDLTALTYLDFSFNPSITKLPYFGNLKKLEELYIGGLQLGGQAPTFLGQLKALSSLGMYDSNFKGTIPAGVYKLTKLMYLAVNGNQFHHAPIPNAISNLVNLQRFYAYDNKFKGTIPAVLGKLTKLEVLDLATNAISGTIPKELSTLTLLEELYLNDNKLTGNIPTQFTKLAAMQYFYVNNNALSKAIPTTLGAWGAAVAAAGDIDICGNKQGFIAPVAWGFAPGACSA